MHTSLVAAHSLTQGDVIYHGGVYLRITDNPHHDYTALVPHVHCTVTPHLQLSASPARRLTFGLNQSVARVVGARTNGL